MQTLSRRTLAAYAADRLAAGTPAREVARQLAAVLVATKRTSQVEQLRQDIAYELEERGLAAQVQLTTAAKVDESLIKLIEKFVAHQTGARQISLARNVDESVIGGFSLETARLRWDQTIKRKLTDIQEAF